MLPNGDRPQFASNLAKPVPYISLVSSFQRSLMRLVGLGLAVGMFFELSRGNTFVDVFESCLESTSHSLISYFGRHNKVQMVSLTLCRTTACGLSPWSWGLSLTVTEMTSLSRRQLMRKHSLHRFQPEQETSSEHQSRSQHGRCVS